MLFLYALDLSLLCCCMPCMHLEENLPKNIACWWWWDFQLLYVVINNRLWLHCICLFTSPKWFVCFPSLQHQQWKMPAKAKLLCNGSGKGVKRKKKISPLLWLCRIVMQSVAVFVHPAKAWLCGHMCISAVHSGIENTAQFCKSDLHFFSFLNCGSFFFFLLWIERLWHFCVAANAYMCCQFLCYLCFQTYNFQLLRFCTLKKTLPSTGLLILHWAALKNMH